MKPIRELLMKIDTNINKTATSSNFQSWVRYSLFHLQKKSVAKQNQYFLSVSADIRMPCQKYRTQLWKLAANFNWLQNLTTILYRQKH